MLELHPILVGVVLAIVGWRISGRLSGRIATIARVSLLLHLLATVLYRWIVTEFYGGTADFLSYHRVGEELAPQLRQFDFQLDVGRVVGTNFIRIVTGAIYAVLGSHLLVGFLVFSFFTWLGLMAFYKAFSTGLPGDHGHRFAVGIFLLPSLLFWGSAIGKDAWMVLCLGVSTWGLAMLVRRRAIGLVPLVFGLAAGAMARPHVMLIFAIAAAIGFVLARPVASVPGGSVAKVLVGVVLLGGSFVLTSQVADRFELGSLDIGTADALLDRTEELSQGERNGRTLRGSFGSSYDPSALRTPVLLPLALGTVLFRPLPIEAHNLPSFVSSLEGLMLFAVVALFWRSLLSSASRWRQDALVGMSIVYVLIFGYVFVAIGNFGILARQRIQVLPFLIILLALQERQAVRKARGSPRLWDSLPARWDLASTPRQSAHVEPEQAL